MKDMDASYFWNKVTIKLAQMEKSVEWLCRETGLNVRTMKNRIAKGIQPRLDDAVKILEVFGTTLEAFCGITGLEYREAFMETAEKSLEVPVYKQLFSAGHGQFLSEEEEISGYVSIPESLRRYKDHLAATYVRGDSMEPTLSDGDTIICDDMGYDGKGGIYVIHYKGMGFVKRLKKEPDGVSIISDNPTYKTMFESSVSEDFRVVGKVRYVMRDL